MSFFSRLDRDQYRFVVLSIESYYPFFSLFFQSQDYCKPLAISMENFQIFSMFLYFTNSTTYSWNTSTLSPPFFNCKENAQLKLLPKNYYFM